MTLNILLYVSIGLFVLVVVAIIVDRTLAYKKKKMEIVNGQTGNPQDVVDNVEEEQKIEQDGLDKQEVLENENGLNQDGLDNKDGQND